MTENKMIDKHENHRELFVLCSLYSLLEQHKELLILQELNHPAHNKDYNDLTS